MKEYRVQAILIDKTGRNTIETVIDSIRTTDYEKSLDFVMKKHIHNTSYLYIAMDIETREIIVKTNKNKYQE